MFSAYNIAAFVGLWLVLVFLLVAAFVPTLLPDNRRSVALFGIALIVCAHYYLIDTPALHIYTSDLLKILGLCLVIAWPTRMLVPESVREERAQKNVEIIEV